MMLLINNVSLILLNIFIFNDKSETTLPFFFFFFFLYNKLL